MRSSVELGEPSSGWSPQDLPDRAAPTEGSRQVADFGYVSSDGAADPTGIHVQRAHRRVDPRGQPVVGGGSPTEAPDSHRLIRRGMPYGRRTSQGSRTTASSRRSLRFINSSIENRYEFGAPVGERQRVRRAQARPEGEGSAGGSQDLAESILVIPGRRGSADRGDGLLDLRDDQGGCVSVLSTGTEPSHRRSSSPGSRRRRRRRGPSGGRRRTPRWPHGPDVTPWFPGARGTQRPTGARRPADGSAASDQFLRCMTSTRS